MINEAHIMVVDDMPDVQKVLKSMLEQQRYGVDTASDGKSALNLLKRNKPDLVLLDIKMPGLSGYQVLEQIRQQSNVPVIMLTGLLGETAVAQSFGLGADDYIRKPVSMQTLLARIHAKLKRTPPGTSFYKTDVLEMMNKAHILVVDDVPGVRKTLKSILEQQRYGVDTAPDGKSAMGLLKRNKPDLVLLDIKMPGLSGYQVLEQIRQQSNVPVIMLTGLLEATEATQSSGLGADDYIRKPVNTQLLMARIDAKLKRTPPGTSFFRENEIPFMNGY